MNIDEYKATFDNSELWFVEEVTKSYHMQRVANVIENKKYLSGEHAITDRRIIEHKGEKITASSIVLNKANTIINFHNSFLLGDMVTLTGNDEFVETLKNIYSNALYRDIDYRIHDKVLKFGDSYEHVYYSDGVIQSKIIDSAHAYPVYDDFGNYLSFIEYWEDGYSKISYYNVYYDGHIEQWNNKGGEFQLVAMEPNVTGLPIHYRSHSELYDTFGSSFVDTFKNLIDELESIHSKVSDGVYKNSLNPINVAIGQCFKGTVPDEIANAMVLQLDGGSEYKVVSTKLDSQTLKLHIDYIKDALNDIACVPHVLNNNNVANVSEVSLKLLFATALLKAKENEQWLRKGMMARFSKIKKLLELQGQDYSNAVVNINFNYDMPVVADEILNNLKTQRDMNAISIKSIIEKSPLSVDLQDELDRIAEEQGNTSVK